MGVIQNMKILDANRRQCDNEFHLLKLAENELSTSKCLTGDVKKEIIILDEQNHIIEKNMTRINEKIDFLGTDMQWMKNALIEWAKAIDHDDNTNSLIEKYCKEDQRRADILEVRRLAIQKGIVKNQSRLNELESEKQSFEKMLERTAKLFQQTIVERRQMTETWTAAVESLNAQNVAIHETMEKVTQIRTVYERKTIELKEQVEFLNQQIQNNKESEFMIAGYNEQISSVRLQLNRYSENIQLQTNELITLRQQVQNTTNCLQSIRQKNHKAVVECDTKAREIIKMKSVVDELMSKVGKIKSEKNNAENRLRHLDELFEDEERAIHAIELEISRLSQMVYRSSQLIQQQHNDQKLIETEIKMISANFTNQEKELARQMELQYDIHFKTLKLECRIAKMEGHVKELDPEQVERSEHLQKVCLAKRDKREKIKKELSSAEETERRLRPMKH